MNFQPQNRYLLVKTQTQEDAENTGVLLPEGYASPKDKYVLATVLDSANDCKRESNLRVYINGSRIIIDSSMVEAVSMAGERYEIVLENYVVGMLLEEE